MGAPVAASASGQMAYPNIQPPKPATEPMVKEEIKIGSEPGAFRRAAEGAMDVLLKEVKEQG